MGDVLQTKTVSRKGSPVLTEILDKEDVMGKLNLSGIFDDVNVKILLLKIFELTFYKT